MLKTLTLTSTRVFSGYLISKVVGKVVDDRAPDPDAQEFSSNKEKIQATILYMGGMLAVALISNYASEAITTYVEKTFWPEEK